jgi:hypothetical protein
VAREIPEHPHRIGSRRPVLAAPDRTVELDELLGRTREEALGSDRDDVGA